MNGNNFNKFKIYYLTSFLLDFRLKDNVISVLYMICKPFVISEKKKEQTMKEFL